MRIVGIFNPAVIGKNLESAQDGDMPFPASAKGLCCPVSAHTGILSRAPLCGYATALHSLFLARPVLRAWPAASCLQRSFSARHSPLQQQQLEEV